MKNVIKTVVFVIGFVILFYFFSYVSLSNANIKKFGIYKASLYEILGEKEDSIDVVVIGDSLVYSSVSPMEIYGKYGFTAFDCSEPAQIFSDALAYYKVAVESQHPKVVIIGANIFFRDGLKKSWDKKVKKVIQNNIPLIIYHDNWKKLLFSNYGRINYLKGFKLNKNIKPSENKVYMKTHEIRANIPEKNIEYFEEMLEIAKENNIKIVLMGFPSQVSWYYKKHNAMLDLAKKYNLEYINFNLEDLGIDWTHDTKDKGEHLNYYGAKIISDYVGNYLKNLNILEDHRNDKEYDEWKKAYEIYLRKVNEE